MKKIQQNIFSRLAFITVSLPVSLLVGNAPAVYAQVGLVRTSSQDFFQEGVRRLDREIQNMQPGHLSSPEITLESCPAGVGAVASNFVVTGSSGLSPTPRETLSSNTVLEDGDTLNPRKENRSSPTVSTNPTAPAPAPLVEATGWVTNNKGEVVLTAQAPNATNIPWMTTASCHTP